MITLHTSMGDIIIALDFKNAPRSAENFLHYASSGFYNGVIFHRVIDGFMIQTGGFKPNMVKHEHPAKLPPIQNEANQSSCNRRGTVALARTTDPHSATSQLFINVVDNHFLDYTSQTPTGWGYCTFGSVVKGMDVVDKIRKLPTTSCLGYRDVPVEDVIIKSVSIDKKALNKAQAEALSKETMVE